MADVLGNFGRKRSGSGSCSWPLGSPNKKLVTDPGRVRVELKCCRHSVEAKRQFGADRMKANLLRATVLEFTAGLVWNVAQKDMDEPRKRLTRPSLDLVKALRSACNE